MKKATPCIRTEWPRFREETHPKVRQSRPCERGGTLGRLKKQDRTVASRFQEEQSILRVAKNRHEKTGVVTVPTTPECLIFFGSGCDFGRWNLALIELPRENFPHHAKRKEMGMNQRQQS